MLIVQRQAIALSLAIVLAQTNFSYATWYGENVEDGADIIMMDLRWPWWPSGSYFANWNTSFNPKPNNLSFYAGFTSYLPDGPDQTPNPDPILQDSFRPGSVWSFWGSNDAGTPARFMDVAPYLYIKNNYGGEGSSGTVGGVVWPFIERDHWYTMVARVWQTDEPDVAYVGRWIKDHRTQHWHLIGIANLPISASSFTGNSGFLEPLTSEKAVRSIHRRFGYYRKQGQWKSSDTISIDKTQYVVVNTVPEADHQYAAIEYAQRPDWLPHKLSGQPISADQKHFFKVTQRSQPVLDQPLIEHAVASQGPSAVVVSWSIPPTSTPGLSFKAELLANADGLGEPLQSVELHNPSARHVLVPTIHHAAAVKLTMTDIFDQATSPTVIPISPEANQAAIEIATPMTAGIQYKLYHQNERRQQNYFNPPQQSPDERHYWLTLDELKNGTLVRRGISRGFDLSILEGRSHGYAIVFDGLLHVPDDDAYLFHAQIDGAYQIELDGKELVSWDGQHGTTERAAHAMLAKGLHPIRITYLYDDLPANNFRLEWQSSRFERGPIEIDSLRTTSESRPPISKIDAVSLGDGIGRVRVKVDARGHQLTRTKLYLGDLLLAEAPGGSVEYQGPLLAGENCLWARTLFNEMETIDTPLVSLDIPQQAPSPEWTLRNVSDKHARTGFWHAKDGSFQFFGNGMHTITQRISGDFQLTCRIDQYNGSNGEPVNPEAWVGLTAREHGEQLNWNWGRDFQLVQTVRRGVRSSPDFTDFGGTRLSSYALQEQRPWLRITRRGDIWSAWTSEDGNNWALGAYQFKKMQPELDVGLFVSALPQDAQAHFSANISQVTIQRGENAFLMLPLPMPVPPSVTSGNRITGVVVAHQDQNLVVLRTNHQGILRSTDGGHSWSTINGNLSDSQLAVRSVAIDPNDANHMLCAIGAGAMHDSTDGLWATEDAGATWKRLNIDIDFDGLGPSAICGEVIAFDLKHPNTIYVGGESKGFFKSTDKGQSWIRIGVQQERITSVVIWPWEHHYPAPAKGKSHICVTTCPDSWMAFLSRGEPSIKTTGHASRAYVSDDDVHSLRIADQRLDTGFYNVAFDKALQSVNEMRYATTHGYQTQVFEGVHMSLYPSQKQLEWLRPFTAVAAAAQGDQKFGRFITQAVAPETPGRYSMSERWAFEWSWLQPQGDVPASGLIAVACDVHDGKTWYFVHADGLYRSLDGGTTLKKVLDNASVTSQ